MANSGSTMASALNGDQFHLSRAMRKNNSVVMTMTLVTAMPYAPASLLEVWNPTTSPMQPTISNQLTNGTYTWPWCSPLVCLIATRGK